MAEENAIPNNNNDVLSENDPLDINELASLNEEISNEFIEQLQNKISEETNVAIKNDGDLFEEPSSGESKGSATFNNDIDDNFIKKYKAKLKKQSETTKNNDSYNLRERTVPEVVSANADTTVTPPAAAENDTKQEPIDIPVMQPPVENTIAAKAVISTEDTLPAEDIKSAETIKAEPVNAAASQAENGNIEAITGGNIIEKPIKKEDIAYNESLDMLDNNVKYSKYVIYIDPENKDFIDSLTVKERKNLINKIIKEQDSIAVTKKRFGNMQAILAHAFVAIITIAIAVPCIYWTINASLEATINNYRASQVVFGQLYKEHGKIKTTKNVR